MAEHNRHISIQRMARLVMNPSDPDRAVLRQHLYECEACREVFEEVKQTVERMPMPGHLPALSPARITAPCPRVEEMAFYARLQPVEKLSLWAHVAFGRCEDCARAAREAGLTFDIRKDPVTQWLVEQFGARSPRRETPEFLFAMAGAERCEAGRTEAMNAVVMLAVRPRKRSYRVSVYRTKPAEPGGFWRVRVQFAKDARLPRSFSMFIYQDGSPEKPLRTSYTGEMELDLPEGIYHLNLGNQDHLLIPLVSPMP
jgi:hypothetical protein